MVPESAHDEPWHRLNEAEAAMRAYWVAYLAGRVTHLDVMVAELAYMDAYCEWNQWPYSEWPHRRAPEGQQ